MLPGRKKNIFAGRGIGQSPGSNKVHMWVVIQSSAAFVRGGDTSGLLFPAGIS